jgi:hypothetical protein
MFLNASAVVAKHIRQAIRVSMKSLGLQHSDDLQQWYAACSTRLHRPRPKPGF